MPPRRAAAAKSAAATAAVSNPKAAAAPKASGSKKRSSDDISPASDDDDADDNEDEEEEVKPPKKKKAKTAATKKAATAPTRASGRKKTDPASTAAAVATQPAAVATTDDDADKKDDVKQDSPKAITPPAAKPASKAPEPAPKMVKVVKRGKGVPVDGVSGLASTHQVLEQGGEVFDAMLQQTDIKANANKFYVIQLLHPIGNTGNTLMFTRWGRTGENGQTQRKGPFDSATAISQFYAQFKSKTGSSWDGRKTMVRKNGKYHWIERDFNEDDEKEEESAEEDDGDDAAADGDIKGKGKAKARAKTPECTAVPEVQDLVKLIFNTQLMDNVLREFHYDANKLPLGKLSKATILQGFSVLKTLSEVIDAPNGPTAQGMGGWATACDRLSSDYYSIIPHSFNRNQRPIPIKDKEHLKMELDLVDALGDMTIASKLLQSSSAKDEEGNAVNPIDAKVKGLNLKSIEPLPTASKEFKALETYVHDSHGTTHAHLKGAKVQAIFKVERNGEEEAYTKAGHDKEADGNRMLLWHGSRTTNFGGILSQGLRIAPPEAPVSGYMFGKGVYFADASSKSLGYTYHHLSDNTGLLLLCEVATKPVLELDNAAYNADELCKNANALATKGLGTYQPTEWKDVADVTGNDELRGVVMPIGKLGDVKRRNLMYNEYIVYDTAQIRLRYLLRVSFGSR